MWSYLTNSNSTNPNLLTFECVDSEDYTSLAIGYCKLIMENFFSSFSSDYNAIFISEYGPNSDPHNQKKLFEMRFDDMIGSKKYLSD
jgi:hypothetical protein